MACSKEASCQEASYTHLLEPCNSWALNFILDTVCLSSINTIELQAARQKVNDGQYTLLTGSVYQGLGLPSFYFKEGRDSLCHRPDIDEMIQVPPSVVIDKHSPDNTVRLIGVIDTTETSPGYLRIQPTENSLLYAVRNGWEVVKRGPMHYLCGDNYVNRVGEMYHKCSTERNGPALTSRGPPRFIKQTVDMLNKQDLGLTRDRVMCLKST